MLDCNEWESQADSTRCASEIRTSQMNGAENGAAPVFRRVPCFEDNCGIVEFKEAAGLSVEWALPVHGLIRSRHLGDFERRRPFPSEAAQGNRVDRWRTGNDVAKLEVAALCGAIVRVPIVVHCVGEDPPLACAEFFREGDASDVSEGH